MTDTQLKELKLFYLNSRLRDEKAKQESYDNAYRFHNSSIKDSNTHKKLLMVITNCNVAAMLMDACTSAITSLEEQIAEMGKEGKA